MRTSGANSCANLEASTTLSTSGALAEPLVEKLSIATRGSMSKILAVCADSTAISANSCAEGLMLIAQSAKTNF